MIRLERNPEFWHSVSQHPDVLPHISMGQEFDIREVVAHPGVTPLASEHGGFLFVRLDAFGFLQELHTLYTPEGWGKEVAKAAREAFTRMFEGGAQMITTYEQEGHWRSKPPKSHGWSPVGEEVDVNLPLRLKMWILTRDAWLASPVGKRMSECP